MTGEDLLVDATREELACTAVDVAGTGLNSGTCNHVDERWMWPVDWLTVGAARLEVGVATTLRGL